MSKSLGQSVIDKLILLQEYRNKIAFANKRFARKDRCYCVSAVESEGTSLHYVFMEEDREYLIIGYVDRPDCPGLRFLVTAFRGCNFCNGTGFITNPFPWIK